MKRRTLNDDGSFTNFDGPKPTYKVVPQEQKIAQRKEMEKLAFNYGFNPNSPAEGGLSEADEKFLKSGASPAAIAALYNVRGLEAPEATGAEAPKSEGLSEEDKDLVKAGISIPEMRKLAKDRGVVIPGDKKKAVAIQEFLLDAPKEEEEEEEEEL